jgi:hypothetical protein
MLLDSVLVLRHLRFDARLAFCVLSSTRTRNRRTVPSQLLKKKPPMPSYQLISFLLLLLPLVRPIQCSSNYSRVNFWNDQSGPITSSLATSTLQAVEMPATYAQRGVNNFNRQPCVVINATVTCFVIEVTSQTVNTDAMPTTSTTQETVGKRWHLY